MQALPYLLTGIGLGAGLGIGRAGNCDIYGGAGGLATGGWGDTPTGDRGAPTITSPR